MQKGLSLVELAQRLEALKADKKDLIADTGSVVEMVAKPGVSAELVVTDQGSFPIRPIAHRQIASRLSIPAAYYDRMQAEQPELLASNVNTWFKANPEKRLLRMLGGANRAFLSNRYQRVENDAVASVVLPILIQTPGVEVISCEVTERRMYIQAINRNVTAKVEGSKRVGDFVHNGVVISNSEIGFGAVSVSDFDYFLACLNGMISSKLLRAAHIGRQIEDNADLWADDTVAADDQVLVLKVRDMVKAAMDPARFHARIEKMSNLTQVKIGANPAAAVEVLGQRIGATQEETGGILKALIEGGDLSAWGVVNAVTAQAHTLANYDRAVEFEAAGGQLLEMKPGEWKEVLEAEVAPIRRRPRGPVIDATFSEAA